MTEEWLKGCEICDAGFCAEMDKFTNEHNMSQRTAAEELAKVIENKLGFQVYSPEALRKRYQRHTGKLGRNVPRTKPGSKTAPRTSSVASTVVPKPKQAPDVFQNLLAHAHAIASGLQSWCDGKIKPSSNKEVETTRAILDALADIIRQYKRLSINAQTEEKRQEDQTT